MINKYEKSIFSTEKKFSPTFRICTWGFFGVLKPILRVPGPQEGPEAQLGGGREEHTQPPWGVGGMA